MKDVRFQLYLPFYAARWAIILLRGHVFGTQNIKPRWLRLTARRSQQLAVSIPADFDLDHRDQSASVLLPTAA